MAFTKERLYSSFLPLRKKINHLTKWIKGHKFGKGIERGDYGYKGVVGRGVRVKRIHYKMCVIAKELTQ